MSHHDDRLKKAPDPRQVTRTSEDAERVSDPTVAVKQQERMFRNEFTQESLPAPPCIPGWHFCWISTTNPQDPPHRRLRIGYEPVRAEECPGYEHLRLKSGQFEGCISINEMLLFKIPEDLYQQIMTEFHYKAPYEEEQRLRANLPGEEYKDSSGKPLVKTLEEDTGFHSLRSDTLKSRPPTF